MMQLYLILMEFTLLLPSEIEAAIMDLLTFERRVILVYVFI